MPPKKQQNTKKPQPKPAANPVRRRRRRGRGQNNMSQENYKPGNTRAMVARNFQQAGVAHATMNAIAKALCAPRDIPPIRLPEVVRRRTDVKHLYTMTEFSYADVTVLADDKAPFFGDSQLNPQQGILVVLRNPLAPLIYPVEWRVPANSVSVYNWQLYGKDRTIVVPGSTLTGGATNYAFLPPYGLVKASPDAPVVYTPNADNAYLAPMIVFYDTASITPPPGGVEMEPSYMDSNKNYWGWYGGGRFLVSALHMSTGGTPAPQNLNGQCGITIELSLQRHNGTADPDEVWVGNCVIQASASSGQVLVDVNLPIGYYRFTVNRVLYAAGFADFSYGHVGLRVVKTLQVSAAGGSTWNMSHVFINPINPVFTSATYLLEACRVNAMAALVTNVTPTMTAGGDVYGLRVPAGEDWTTFGLTKIMGLSGAQRTGYRGPLKNGAYTWLEFPDDYNKFKDHVFMVGSASGSGIPTFGATPPVPACYIDDPASAHIIAWDSPVYSSITGSVTRLQIRCDYHVEFVSSSQLSNSAISPLQVTDLTSATMALANAPLFTENWVHLDQLWRSIKSVGGKVLAAGGRAAASAALRELLSAAAGVGLAM